MELTAQENHLPTGNSRHTSQGGETNESENEIVQ